MARSLAIFSSSTCLPGDLSQSCCFKPHPHTTDSLCNGSSRDLDPELLDLLYPKLSTWSSSPTPSLLPGGPLSVHGNSTLPAAQAQTGCVKPCLLSHSPHPICQQNLLALLENISRIQSLLTIFTATILDQSIAVSFFFSFFSFFFGLSVFLGLHPQHMEVPRLGVQLEL